MTVIIWSELRVAAAVVHVDFGKRALKCKYNNAGHVAIIRLLDLCGKRGGCHAHTVYSVEVHTHKA